MTRLSGMDGVSLETLKWDDVLNEMGHHTYYIAGQLDTPGDQSMQREKFHFKHPDIKKLQEECFRSDGGRSSEVTEKIRSFSAEIKSDLYDFLNRFDPDLLIAENSLTIPVNIPLGIALTELIAETGIDVIAHHHDFYWERDRFLRNNVWDYLEGCFPPRFKSIEHVVINSPAGQQLAHRTGLSSTLIPNVINFEEEPPDPDEYSADVRESFGIEEEELFVLQPTRIVPRKNIEEAIELLSYIEQPSTLLISHASGDEGYEYEKHLRRYAKHMDVDTRFESERIAHSRGKTAEGEKIYRLWDVYPHADIVTYPSVYEGFGNAFIESVYFRKPIVVNDYSVYAQDIKPKGFRVVEFDGYIRGETVERFREVLANDNLRREMVKDNYRLAKKYYSYSRLERELTTIINSIRGE
jgi:glycosyltransferase involved in cell wall biosynthesis